MRLCSYDGGYGLMVGDMVHDAGEAFRAKHADLSAVLAEGALAELEGAALANPGVAAEDLTLLSPLPRPDKILCIGLNYMGHIQETGRDKPGYPSTFTRYPDSVTGHGQPLICPNASDKFDFEGELAVVIGTPARHVSEADAMDYVAGYCCFNDGSIRDFQRHTSQFWPGKNFESSGAMGPWLVTKDEAGAWEDMMLETRLNGLQVQHSPVGDLAFGVPEIIAYLSTVITLLPGDVIATGTPAGVGMARDPKLWMKDGDVVEVEITGLGTLRNPVQGES